MALSTEGRCLGNEFPSAPEPPACEQQPAIALRTKNGVKRPKVPKRQETSDIVTDTKLEMEPER